MLFAAGATQRRGSTSEGTSVLDFEDEEREKGMTINGATAYCGWRGHVLHIVDLPGYLDFIGEMTCGLMPVETGLLCVDLAAGIKVTTRKAWDLMGRMGVARMVVLTKVDQEPTKIDEVMDAVRGIFGAECVPFAVMDGTRVVPLLPLGGDASEEAKAAHTRAMEKVVETDEALMDKYLGGETPTDGEMSAALRAAVAGGEIVPVFITGAAHDVGVKELLDFIVFGLPGADRPPGRKAKRGEEEIQVPLGPNEPLCAQVFKIVTDPYVGKLAFFRVYAGRMSVGGGFHNPRTGRNERIGNLYKTVGKEQTAVEELSAGEFGAVSKVERIKVGDTLCSPEAVLTMAVPEFAEPMVAYAVVPKSRSDEEKISGALNKMQEEDATFKARWETETGELVVRGNSTLHLDVMLKRLKRRFGIDVETRLPTVPYRETVLATSEGHYKHKKQTGGRGQYGEVYLRIEPLERGGGFEFVDAIVGGVIPRQFIPSVEKGVVKAMEKGVVAGFPVQDVKVTVYDGSHHSVDSDDNSFRIAGERAFQDGMSGAKPVLLEPIAEMEVIAPIQYMGDLMGDLNTRRARISGTDTVGDQQVIKAEVPLAEIMTYSTQLRSITGGEGTYTVSFSRYDVVPSNMVQQIVARRQQRQEQQKK